MSETCNSLGWLVGCFGDVFTTAIYFSFSPLLMIHQVVLIPGLCYIRMISRFQRTDKVAQVYQLFKVTWKVNEEFQWRVVVIQ